MGNKKGYKCQNREPPTQFFQIALNGEQTYCRNLLLDKVSKMVLGHNVEFFFQIGNLVQNVEFYQTIQIVG